MRQISHIEYILREYETKIERDFDIQNMKYVGFSKQEECKWEDKYQVVYVKHNIEV